MHRPVEPGFAPALVIAGMHRSGTSLVAGSCRAAGLRIGDRLLGAYRGNEAGHFEDLDFVEWHQLVLRANGLAPEGFVTQATPPVPTALAQKAEALVAARRELGECWGWKDPRTTLHLEFWRHMVPEARFLFVVRRPWEVIDSLFRRGDEAFRLNPPFAIQVWLHYNRLVRDFAVKYPDRSLVCDLSQFVENPAAVFEAAGRVLGVPLGEPPDRFRPELLGQRTEASRIAFLAATCPEAITLYAELVALAGSEPPRLDVGPGDRGVVTGHGFQEWSHCRHLGGRMQLLDQALTEANDANAGLTAELTAAREARAAADQQTRDELAALHRGLDLARRQLADSEARQEQVTRTLAEQAEARAALESQVAGLEQRLATAVAERDRAGKAAEMQALQLEARLRDATDRSRELAQTSDHDRQELAAIAAERASLDTARVQAETRFEVLKAQSEVRQARTHQLDAGLAAAEARITQSEAARSDLERQLLAIKGSNSWQLTRPLRSFRRRTMSRPTDWLRRKVSKTGRRWWRSLPISIATK